MIRTITNFAAVATGRSQSRARMYGICSSSRITQRLNPPPHARVAHLRLHFEFFARRVLGGDVGGGDLRGGQRLCELAAHKRAASLFAALKEFSKSCRINIRQFGSLATSHPLLPHPHPLVWNQILVSCGCRVGAVGFGAVKSRTGGDSFVLFGFFPGPVLEFLENGEGTVPFPLPGPCGCVATFSTLCLPLRSSRVSQDAGTVGAPSISHPATIPAREHATVWKNFR